jgi:HKD family nuclease
MRFLASSSEIDSALRTLTKKCTRLRWAVAWASHGFPLFDLLVKHRDKIEQLTVGVHFYQTHPDFMAEFLDHDAVRFVMNPSGVFHPKVYLFDLGRGHWECVAGSPNFTKSAFTANAEVAVHFTDRDNDAEPAYAKVTQALDAFYNNATTRDEKDLEAYRSQWKRQQRRLSPLSGSYQPPTTVAKPPKSPLDVPLFKAGWSEYFESVREDPQHGTEGRLAVLEEARRLFTTHEHFCDVDPDNRKGIAGFQRTKKFDWLWFGSMKGAGYFKEAINKNDKNVSLALDEIPLAGPVVQEHYDRYVQTFRSAFSNAATATATRLLAFKRPDYFVCLDSKNRDKLCEQFEIAKRVDLDDYWEKVIDRIMDSNWWDSPEPTDELERRVWRCRAAFLDVRFCDPDA